MFFKKADKKAEALQKEAQKNESLAMKSFRFIGEVFYNIITILLIVIVLRTFIVSPFHVSGTSMTSTLQNNDYIIIEKLSYRFSEPEFGDIVVFTPPTPRMRQVDGVQCFLAEVSAFHFSDKECKLPDFFIKRVIGVPGDIIEVKDGEVFRNGEILDEVYLDQFNAHRTFVPEEEQYKKYEVPAGRYFVLGDNRNGSSDSRAHAYEWRSKETGDLDPFVFQEDIEGRLLIRLVSPKKIQEWF